MNSSCILALAMELRPFGLESSPHELPSKGSRKYILKLQERQEPLRSEKGGAFACVTLGLSTSMATL